MQRKTVRQAVCAMLAAASLCWLGVPGTAGVAQADDTAPATVAVGQTDALGPFLTDAAGMTLYIFQRDQPDASACTGGCATTWPPLLVDSDVVAPPDLPGVLGTSTRPEGSIQVTYNHQPLYRYVRDAQPGDTTGQAVGGVWFVTSLAASM